MIGQIGDHQAVRPSLERAAALRAATVGLRPPSAARKAPIHSHLDCRAVLILIVALELADQGRYVASESSFYRVLREADQLAHRGKAKPAMRQRPKPLQARAANQLWSWDITYLATTVAGVFFYLYLIMDVFSRKIVGWEVYASESADHAAAVFRKAHLREAIAGGDLVLHSDNGSPMKGATMLATLQRLGVMPSFSRPSVSDDNPYSEALFKTLKYHPGFPDKPFERLDEARQWVATFTHWYNEIHRHSALRFVTPGQRHCGEDIAVLAQRQALYEAAKAEHPERWSGAIRNWEPEETVYLNPGKPLRINRGETDAEKSVEHLAKAVGC